MFRERIVRIVAVLTVAAGCVAIGMLPRSSQMTVSGQQTPGWRVWIKSSPCSVTRQDWVSVAQADPTQGGGGSFWYIGNQIIPGLACTSLARACSFADANSAMSAARGDRRFLNFCCHDYAVYENVQTKERAYIKSGGNPGFGWTLVQASLCCEEAQSLAGKSGGCGVGDQNGYGKYAEGTDMPGNDLYNIEIERPDIERCEQACLGEFDVCRGYTYVRPGVQGAKARCWLKTAVGPTVPNACCTSAVVNSSGKFSPPGKTGSTTHVDDDPVIISKRMPDGPQPPVPTRSPTPSVPDDARLPAGVRPCNASEREAFAKLIGTHASGRGKLNIGGSCENATGDALVTEYCENPDATYNKTLPRYTFNLKGRMDGAAFSFTYTSSDSRSPRGTGYCSLSGNGISCSGISCL